MTTTALKVCLVLLLFAHAGFAQRFVTLDNDTHEFIEDVNYTLYKGGKMVSEGITLSNDATSVDGREFDSISFSRVDYEAYGFLKDSLPEAVFMNKKAINLDEVVINSQKQKEIVLGEANHFIKSRAGVFVKELDYGIMFSNDFQHPLTLNKVVFHVAKIKYKTAYRLKLYNSSESSTSPRHRFLELGEPMYTSGLLYLNRKDDKKVEIALPDGLRLEAGKSVFAQIELMGYNDKEGKEIMPDKDDRTKLAFQFSNKVNYYSRMSNSKGELTSFLINSNALINYDFAHVFYSKPHKSNLVAPAMVLYSKKVD